MKHKTANNAGTSLELDAAAGPEARPSLLPVPGHPVIIGAGSKYPLVMLSSRAVRMSVQLDEDLRIEALSDFSRLSDFMHEVWIFAQDASLDDLIQESNCASIKVGTHHFGCGHAQWALSEGLVPGQPFRVELFARHYMSEGPDGAEGDCEAYCKIFKKTGHDPKRAAGYWEKWFQELAHLAELAGVETSRSRQAMLGRHDLLAVRMAPFWSQTQSGGDCSAPDGFRITLCSTLKPMRTDGSPAFSESIQLASGESAQCQDEKAWENLAAEVRKKLPQFAGVDLKKLPQHAYGRETPVVI